MSKWLFEKYVLNDLYVSSDELTIWVLHADKAPPHIGISSEKRFYSLKINGKDEGLEIKSLLNLIQKKAIPTLAITLTKKLKEVELKKIFNSFSSKIKRQQTCLSPIVEILKPQLKDLILVELLEELNKNQEINSVYGFNLPAGYQGIPSYTRETIQQRINAVQPSER
jgi:hypothetical protein